LWRLCCQSLGVAQRRGYKLQPSFAVAALGPELIKQKETKRTKARSLQIESLFSLLSSV
jgi:hypothetical protein